MILAIALVSVVLLLVAAPRPALADTSLTVDTASDTTNSGDHACSLREAILFANRSVEPDGTRPDCAPGIASGTTTIHVPPGDYVLGGNDLTLTGNVVISGAGASTTTIDAGGRSNVILVNRGVTATISGITVTGGNSGSACIGPCLSPNAIAGVQGGGIENEGTLTLTGVTVSHNRTGAGGTNCAMNQPGCSAGAGGNGAGIDNTGTLTIRSSTISANVTGQGGTGTAGASAAPGVTATAAGTPGNGGDGAGINNIGTLTISDTTITGNSTGSGGSGSAPGNVLTGLGLRGSNGGKGGSGAGIENTGRLVVTSSTVAGNTTGIGGDGGPGGNVAPGAIGTGGSGGVGGAGGSGAGIDSGTETAITNSTFTNNRVGLNGGSGTGGSPFGPTPPPAQPGSGGAINQSAMGTTLTHVTIAFNTAGLGGGIAGLGGSITAANSIVASNVGTSPNQNCAGVITDQGGNVEFGASSCPGGFLRGDPRLASLAGNGGTTQTIALGPGSAAIHHVRTCVLGTDQRGVGRPVGTLCDSGAYQVAPPSVGGISASAVTTASATIAAAVNPNLQGTTVLVNYGTTPSYGSSTPPQGLGAGNAPAPFAAALTGLQPGTTYHFDVVAINADGTTTTSDGVFTTVPPLTASIAGASTTGPTLSLTIACGGGFGPGTCAGDIRLTSLAAAQRAHTTRVKRKHPPKPVVLTVAAGAYSVSTGGQVTINLRLNRKGQAMLTQHYVLATTLSLGGTTPATQKVTFRYPRITSSSTPISFTFNLASDGTGATLTQLTVTKIPRGGRATVLCRGGGCPYHRRTFVPRRGQLILAPTFQHRKLRLGATVTLEVTATNRVGEVKTFTIGRGGQLIVTSQCLPPGVSHPTRCVAK